MKKVLSLTLALIMTMALAIPALAAEAEPTQSNFTVASPTFPDAYIVTESTPSFQYMDGTSGSLGSVSATVFVEETYDEVDGKIVVTDSRLLSEEEVKAIGEENFLDLNNTPAPQKPQLPHGGN